MKKLVNGVLIDMEEGEIIAHTIQQHKTPTDDEKIEATFKDNEVLQAVTAHLASMNSRTFEQEKAVLIQKYKELRAPKAPGGVRVD